MPKTFKSIRFCDDAVQRLDGRLSWSPHFDWPMTADHCIDMRMFREYDRMFALLFRIADFFFVVLLWCVAFLLRFYVFGSLGSETLHIEAYVKSGIVIAILTNLFFSREGLYRSQRFTTRMDEVRRVVKGHFISTLLFVVCLYFLGGERVSRLQIGIYAVVGLVGHVSFRMVLRGFLRHNRRHGRNLRHIVLVGSGRALTAYYRNLREFPELGVRVTAWQDSGGANRDFEVKEIAASLSEVIAMEAPDAVVLGYEGEKSAALEGALSKIHNGVTQIIVLPDLTYSYIGSHFDSLAGVPALLLNYPNYSLTGFFWKRFFDVVASGLGLVVLSPFFAAIAIGVKLSSPGPAFYWQERIGLDGHRFRMLKFRSMRTGSDVSTEGVPGWTTQSDPRRTKFGTFLRLSSIDEFPQLWNVFIGEMSLVGPRPEQPYYVAKFRQEIPAYMLRHRVKAGITGWAQVNGWRGDTDLNKRIEHDLFYIRNWSLWLDIRILLMTFFKGFMNRNAY